MSDFSRRSILSGAVLGLPLLAAAAPALGQMVASDEIYGMIEIGSSGLKVAAYRIGQEQIADEDTAGVSGRQRLAPRREGSSYDINTNPISDLPRDIDETIQATKDAIARLTTQMSVYPQNVVIVASSGVASFPEKLATLRSRIQAETGYLLAEVTPREEAQLTFDWVVLPHRRRQVAVIDIGSGNTKGGYYESFGTPQQRFRDFSVPLGTKSFANSIKETWPTDPVQLHASDAFQQFIIPSVNDQIESAPGIVNRPRVYLAGGIVWATCLMVHPAAMAGRGNWVRMTSNDFSRLAQLIREGDPYRLARTATLAPTARTWLDQQLTRVSETFDTDQLAAGAALGDGLSRRLNFSTRSAIFFATFAVNAWSSQFLIRRFRDESPAAGR